MEKSELKEILAKERKVYLADSWKQRLLDAFLNRESFKIWHFVKTMRYCDYYSSNKHKSVFYSLLYLFYMRRHNKKCLAMGGQIAAGTFGAGVVIYHINGIVVNGYSQIGTNCKLHGNNCIGNSRDVKDCPIIGNNVRLGVGAKVIGKVYIADDVTIAAGAVVTKSCFERGVTLAGIPARIINRNS